jgi:hypothetical protein
MTLYAFPFKRAPFRNQISASHPLSPLFLCYLFQGCVNKLIDALKNHMSIVVGVGIGIGIIECLGLLFSLILCCGIRNMDRYKA